MIPAAINALQPDIYKIAMQNSDSTLFAVPALISGSIAYGCNHLEYSGNVVAHAIGWLGTRIFTLVGAVTGLIVIIWNVVKTVLWHTLNAVTLRHFEKIRKYTSAAEVKLNQITLLVALGSISLLVVDLNKCKNAISTNDLQEFVNQIALAAKRLGMPEQYIDALQHKANQMLVGITGGVPGGNPIAALAPLLASLGMQGNGNPLAALGGAAAANNQNPMAALAPLLQSVAGPNAQANLMATLGPLLANLGGQAGGNNPLAGPNANLMASLAPLLANLGNQAGNNPFGTTPQ